MRHLIPESQATSFPYAGDLRPGDLIAWGGEAHRVIDVREIPAPRWPDRFTEVYDEAVLRGVQQDTPETWPGRPVSITLQPHKDAGARMIPIIGPHHGRFGVLPAHYLVCNLCGGLPPCRHELAEREAAKHLNRAAELMAIAPGACLGCGQPITTRQKSVTFSGPNLWRPDLGDDSACFHLRKACEHHVAQYRKQWAATGPARPGPEATD